MKLQDIIDGKGKFTIYSGYELKELHDSNTTLSVQASRTHYCTPRNNHGPYTHLEVGFPSVIPPDTWAKYADGDYPAADVYGYVPVSLIKEFIDAHGGETDS
jgi:hypothetical protein